MLFHSPLLANAFRRLAVGVAAMLALGVVGLAASGRMIQPVPQAHAAAADYFLKIEGVPGESTYGRYQGEIQLESFSWGATRPSVAGSGGGAGKVSFQDFHFTMKVNKASPKLMLAVATGKHFPKAVLTVRKAGGEQQEYYTITLSDVLVSSYQSAGSGTDATPMETVSFNFRKIEFEYKPQKPDGTLDAPVKATYDLKTNKGT